ncbi:hypothetical protein BD414DRAFT_480700 [Trametes punicea]|nr:hypothetical protein BD414DRAFT_480700 [Trametes punicea]
MRTSGFDMRLGSGLGFVSCLGTSRSMLRWAIVALLVVVLSTWPALVQAYIPAQPTNQTNITQATGQNTTDDSSLSLLWYPKGSDEEMVSYQLVGAYSTGISKGALVHFSEDKIPNGTTTTPWIALVSCDTNSTNASMEDDIFTLAQERGAVAGLLYSLHSVTCLINPEYSDPAKFNQVMDIFSTKSLTMSQIIEDEFHANDGSSSKYYWYSPTLLNSSASAIAAAMTSHSVTEPGYIFATLTAWNATDNSTDTGSTTSVDGGAGGGSEGKSTNTSLAMIILYAITGCVSALFCIVIISGAIRAIRHPERYGPRSADANAFGGPPGTFGPQSRARGLTRAILDTFPVVKFGRVDAPSDEPIAAKDVESAEVAELSYAAPGESVRSALPAVAGAQDVDVELREWQIVATKLDSDGKPIDPLSDPAAARPAFTRTTQVDGADDPSKRASSSSHVPQPIPRPPKPPVSDGPSGGEKDVVPDAIGRETCPICIVDFEEGDDLRVLPCEGHHRFHRDCVDQWLLELSSSCPICRQDFQALQTMMAAGDDGEHLEPPHMPGAARPLSTAAARFSRYLKFARRRRQRRVGEDANGYDVTARPTSVAEETAA